MFPASFEHSAAYLLTRVAWSGSQKRGWRRGGGSGPDAQVLAPDFSTPETFIPGTHSNAKDVGFPLCKQITCDNGESAPLRTLSLAADTGKGKGALLSAVQKAVSRARLSSVEVKRASVGTVLATIDEGRSCSFSGGDGDRRQPGPGCALIPQSVSTDCPPQS